MSGAVKIAFGALSASKGSALVVFVGADMKPAPTVTAQFGDLEPLIRAAAKASGFRGAQRTALDILAPAGLDASRLMVVGVAPGKDNAPVDFVTLGGFTFGKVTGAKRVEVAFEAPSGMWDGAAAADFALGLRLRGYRFDKYKTRRKDPEEDSLEAPDFVIGSSHAAPRARLRRSASLSPKGSSWRAIWSTSRPTSSFPPSSPIAPRRWRNSASMWKRSTRRRWANWG